ncbi:potassium transporter Kup [Vibrio marisflavi]|uniref:Probable potassium transport system protein Kup n=1 Tax=Vibrio marisflavi CECT 7928 TaxID=634439 RepID=A0ABM9A7Y9_9VIBR|nr:potassium transporter Kup [Vibrio marisflavi]CAH0540824.1 Low affinity potassium transport system protein kup [Vibrio marisflavi CECT 7928]
MQNKKQSLLVLTYLCIGVVYGDIGTSPLYAFKAMFDGEHSLAITNSNIHGTLSLVFWTFIITVSVKYLSIVTRASSDGEGGILTLASLAHRVAPSFLKKCVLFLGMLSAGFFFGEAIITPAMSVLSAVEGIDVVNPSLHAFVIPVSITIICGLFAIQKWGSGKIGQFFAPVMLTWFLCIGLTGLTSICHNPFVLKAINPYYAMEFVRFHGLETLFTLGVVVLAVTGVEALYADMGHFGIKSIRLAWFLLVLPCLVLNYFGQGALVLQHPDAISNSFFLLVPTNLQLPLVVLATFATVIASQAVISGIFSLTRQAINLGFLPPVRIFHTSTKEQGQIYVPIANFLLFILVVAVVISFGSSARLAAAYGIAVTSVILISSLLLIVVALYHWRWSTINVALYAAVMVTYDTLMFTSTSLKFTDGGWLPLTIGTLVFLLMVNWYQEKQRLAMLTKHPLSVEAMVKGLEQKNWTRASGTAVYLARNEQQAPSSLINNLKYNETLHERNILLTFKYSEHPHIHPLKRVELKQLSDTFWQMIAHVGYQESLDIEQIYHACCTKELCLCPAETVFFMSAERIKVKPKNLWHDIKARIFILLSRNALRTSERLSVPEDKLIEIGVHLEI